MINVKFAPRIGHVALLASWLLVGCTNSFDQEVEKGKILAQINLIQEAHLSKDAVQFYKPNLDSFYDVRSGGFEVLKKKDLIASTQDYLDNMEFLELKSRFEPVIQFSDDGSMASYIGDVVVKGLFRDEPVFWVVAWQSVFRKFDGQWKIVSSTNTEAPNESIAPIILQKASEIVGTLGQNASIYALADCDGPGGSFKTLICSNANSGRMEQIVGESHFVMKYDQSNIWTHNLVSKNFTEDAGVRTKGFIQGHELHWLALNPLSKLKNPFFKGFTEFAERSSFHVEFKDSQGSPVNFYYDFAIYTPLGFSIPIGEGKTVSTIFKDWKQLDNVRVFYKAEFIDGNDVFSYDFTEIRLDSLSAEDFDNREALIR